MPRRPPAPKKKSVRLPTWLSVAICLASSAYAALVLLPFRFHAVATGLDASWAVALNFLHVRGAIHGRDVAFTYGPLAYLILPMPMAANLECGLVFQALSWTVFIGLLLWLALRERVPWPWFLLFAVTTIPGSGLLHNFGYAGPDFFLEIVALLALAACAIAPTLGWYALAIVLAAVLVFIKLTSAMAVLLAVVAFPLGLFFFDRRRALIYEAVALTCWPALLVAGYLLHHPSFDSLLRYLRAGWEISSGFTSSMGLFFPGDQLMLALMCICGYVALSATLLFLRDRAFVLAIAGLPALFIEFKHSFVREAGHLDIFFDFAPLLIGVVLLASSRFRWLTLAPLTLALAPLWFHSTGATLQWAARPAQALHTLEEVVHPSQLRRRLETESHANLKADSLPPDLLARLSGHTVTVFPWECSYASANPIQYVPLPVLQTYSAYTPYLDDWDAEFLDKHAPDYLLFEWESIDARHPLLDVPATTLAVYRNYQLDSSYGNLTLLRRRLRPLNPALRPLHSPASNSQLTVAKIHLRPTLTGRLRDLFFRTGEVDLTLTSPDGRYVAARVSPRVLSNGILLNALPNDLQSFRALMDASNSTFIQPLSDMDLGGVGLPDYEHPDIEYYELTDSHLSFGLAPATPDLSTLTSRGDLDASRIETLNDQGVVGISSREVLDIPAPGGFLRLSGWVAAPPGADVYIDLDGRLQHAQTGLNRPDIRSLFGVDHAGIEWFIGISILGHTSHRVKLRVILPATGEYFSSRQEVVFRIL